MGRGYIVEECVEKYLTNLSVAAGSCETGLFIGQVRILKSHLHHYSNAPIPPFSFLIQYQKSVYGLIHNIDPILTLSHYDRVRWM